MLAVNWTAVGAVASVAAVLVAALGLFGPTIWRRLRPSEATKARQESADNYLNQLKVAAKAIDNAAVGRIGMTAAEAELTRLSNPQEKLRRAFGEESAVHWIARLNLGMLSRAFDIARAGSSTSADVSLHELVALGIDNDGFTTFEQEKAAAMKQRDPVRTFASQPSHLRKMADLAQMPSPYGERFEELLDGLEHLPSG